MTMTTYSGPATLILADGARVAGMASLATNRRGDLNGWSGTFRPNEAGTDVRYASDGLQLELPDEQVGAVAVRHHSDLAVREQAPYFAATRAYRGNRKPMRERMVSAPAAGNRARLVPPVAASGSCDTPFRRGRLVLGGTRRERRSSDRRGADPKGLRLRGGWGRYPQARAVARVLREGGQPCPAACPRRGHRLQ